MISESPDCNLKWRWVTDVFSSTDFSDMEEPLSEIDGILHALGEVVARWGHYEDAVFSLMNVVLKIESSHAREALRNELDLKTATAIIRSAALIDTEFVGRNHILQLMKWTDRPLREDRNRFVHDQIYADGDGFEQYQHITRLKKPQAFKEPKTTVISPRPLAKEALQEFTFAIGRAEGMIGIILHVLSTDKPLEGVVYMAAAEEGLARAIASYTGITTSLASNT